MLLPNATMMPATSKPGISDAPGGGGYRPWRCITSGRLTPAAATLINTWLADGVGWCVELVLKHRCLFQWQSSVQEAAWLQHRQ